MIQVYFKKSPTGSPFFLAYSQGEHGFVTEQKAEALAKAGVIDPVSFAQNRAIPPESFIPTEQLEKIEVKPGLNTETGVKATFESDVNAMREYCDEHGIRYGKSAKRPEYFWAKIAKHNSK